jgi:DNA end-binding protein Ku
MAARSIWKGNLSFGLVSFPVKLYKATDDANTETAMRMLHGVCNHPINEKKVCAHCATDVAYGDVVKGVEQADGTFVVLTKDELDSIKPATGESIAIEHFIDANSIDPLYVDASYFLAPDKGAAEGFATMHLAMRDKGAAGQARFTIYGRERIVTLRPLAGGFVLQLMRSKEQVRDIAVLPTYIAPGAVTVNPDMLALAGQVIDGMRAGAPDYTDYEDSYVAEFKALVNAKATGAALPVKASAPAPKAVDLMAALKASLAKGATAPTKAVKAAKPVKPAKAKKAA